MRSPGATVVGIWLAVATMALLAPDMVHGDAQEHLPMALLTAWVWGAAATAYVVMTPRTLTPDVCRTWTLGIVGIWVVAALLVVACPVLVTGTDPTQLPLAVWIVPPLAAVATGWVAIWATKQPGAGQP